MNERRDPDRLIHAFLTDGPTELADPVYDAVRAEIERKRQRVVIGPWRMPDMNKLVPLGVGIAAVAVGIFVGGQLLASPAPGGVGGVPSAQPSVTPLPSPTPSPSLSPATPPPLTQTFTSQMHGVSVSYPEGWTVRAATEPWTDRPGVAEFVDPGLDVLHDPVLADHLFLYIWSQPIGDSTPEAWVAAQLAGSECPASEPIAVDGTTALIGTNECDAVAVATADRGYWISLAASNDDPFAVAAYDRAWFEEVLATVQLRPQDAVGVAPSATP